MTEQYVYFFGDGKADGKADMKNLLGGKGANLAEMTSMGIPVPPGFTITTEVCTLYSGNDHHYPDGLQANIEDAVKRVEEIMGTKFGDPENPLLFSVRSGARQSMPGMMETVLNVGLTTKTIPGLIAKTGNERFVYDAYRRLITMYSDVVMEKAAGVEPEEGQGIRHQLEQELNKKKQETGANADTDLSAEDLKSLCEIYKQKVADVLGTPFPDDHMDQLGGAIGAVFKSWNGKRAISYRRIENIPGEWGTAVNVQTMVFGNMGDSSATGVAFTRNPATGENMFYGEWLTNAQGEDVVAGIRTPNALNEAGKTEQSKDHVTLEQSNPEVYNQLVDIRNTLEDHYKNMQDVEFTVQDGRLWMLQTRTGKRNGPAAVRMAAEMKDEGMIDANTCVMRVTPAQLDELLHPIVDSNVEKETSPLAKGLPAGPGGAKGQLVFTADDAVAWANDGKQVILVREETNPEDVEGMRAAEAILTARGGMTSHAALVARGWGKCCIVGASDLEVDAAGKTLTIGDKTLNEGDMVTLNGTKGYVYEGDLPLVKTSAENEHFNKFLAVCDEVRHLGVRTNADTPADAQKAISFGAEGIGLLRTEHMFYGEGSDEPLEKLRKMILSKTVEERRTALAELLPYMRENFKGTFEAMEGKPVTIRMLDPPLHEFVPHEEGKQTELAESLGISLEDIKGRVDSLRESNPMMGHRGVRLGVTYPEITETTVRAIFEATAELINEGKQAHPEIMIPVTGMNMEVKNQKELVEKVHAEVSQQSGAEIPLIVGTMIEIPRACLTADKMAEDSEFFSFGTNDLTQMGYGFSRDDMGGFLVDYLEKGIPADDPFQTIDQEGIGQLIKMAVEKGRATRPDLKIGICGEQGGEPKSVEFCHNAGLDYVSCSPFRVPIARLSAAQSQVRNPR